MRGSPFLRAAVTALKPTCSVAPVSWSVHREAAVVAREESLMLGSVTVPRVRRRFRRPPARSRSVFAIALVSAFLAVPALAYAGKAPTTRADLAGLAGYCQNYDA